MTQDDFFQVLSIVKHNYRWVNVAGVFYGYSRNGKRNQVYNAVTAVCRSMRKGDLPCDVASTMEAARRIGLSEKVAALVMRDTNRGHVQIVRGKIRKALNEQD